MSRHVYFRGLAVIARQQLLAHHPMIGSLDEFVTRRCDRCGLNALVDNVPDLFHSRLVSFSQECRHRHVARQS